MNILLFSAFLLVVILLMRYFVSSNRRNFLKFLTFFGIIIGLTALGLNYLVDNAFGASTPVNVRTENLTDKNLKIYSIIFWDNNRSGKGNFVYYDRKLKPNEKSNNFWFENDYNTEFWIVGKSENNEIEYLNVITENNTVFDLKITKDELIDPNKAQLAIGLTSKTDEDEDIKKFAIWTNLILIGLLIISLIKIKTKSNLVYT